MRIERVETTTLRVPWGPDDWGQFRDWPVVRIYTDDGRVGTGRGGDALLIRAEFKELLVGQDPARISLHWQRMFDKAWRFQGPGRTAMSSICGIDIALWDLLGQAAGLPVWRLLGGHSNKVPVYADGIGYEDEDADRMAEKVALHSGLGFSHVKIHLPGPDPDENVEKVRRSREALGPDKKLLLDAFRHWDGRTAARVVRRLLEYDLFWVEEPVRMDDELGYLRMVRDVMLGADTECYLAAGEGENTLAGVARLITQGGVQVIQTDPVSVGGYTGLMRVAAVCNAHNALLAPHGSQIPEINCQIGAAIPNLLMIPATPATEPFQIWSRLYDPPFVVDSPTLELTEAPGMGLSLNDDFVREYRVEV